MEIIRDLRLGKFDVLVGINLLREGLDMPEVSLVAIFDADKEGFLRSDRSLIQTIGRAARNVSGKAILYADKITGSMERAMGETERRRNKQIAHNKKHGITPIGIKKSVTDIMETTYTPGKGSNKKRQSVAEKYAEFDVDELATEDVWKHIGALETKMYECAKNLEFEEAGRIRDKIMQLKRKAQ